MPKTAKELGMDILTGAPLSAELRGKVMELLATDADKFLTYVGEHGLRQEDYSGVVAKARGDEAKFTTLYEQNVAWFNENKAALDELETLRARLNGNPNPNPNANPDPTTAPALPAGVITQKQFDEAMGRTEAGALGVIAETALLATQHLHMFQEPLDLRPILGDKRVTQIGIRAVYDDLYKDRLKARADEAQKKREDALRAEGAQAERERLAATRHPYPVSGAPEVSTLDALERPAGTNTPVAASVDDMVANFARLNASRTGAGA